MQPPTTTSKSIANPGRTDVIQMLMMENHRSDISYVDVGLSLQVTDPLTYKDAMKTAHAPEWTDTVKTKKCVEGGSTSGRKYDVVIRKEDI
jgi:hypothetical protein